MNDMERRATQHAVDGLLNYESVKYFGNEQHEVRRYNDYMDKYSRSAVAVQVCHSNDEPVFCVCVFCVHAGVCLRVQARECVYCVCVTKCTDIHSLYLCSHNLCCDWKWMAF